MLVLLGFCLYGCATIDKPPGEILQNTELEEYRGVWIARMVSPVVVNEKREDEDRWPVFIEPIGNGQLTIGYVKLDKGQFVTKHLKVTISRLGKDLYMSTPWDLNMEDGEMIFCRVEQEKDTIRIKWPDAEVFREAASKDKFSGSVCQTTGGVHVTVDEQFERFLDPTNAKEQFVQMQQIQLERADHDFSLPQWLC